MIYADRAYHVPGGKSEPPVMVFLDGSAYQFEIEGTDTVLNYERLTVLPEAEQILPDEFKRKAASSHLLAKSSRPEEIAEFQWRTTSAAKAFVMALLAILLAKTSPRQGRYGKLVIGILLFFLVHAGNLVLKTWIEQGKLSPLPGLWSAVIVLLVLTAVLGRRQA